MKERKYSYLDIARAIAIILMVCGHCDNFGGIISNFVGLFNMSVFVFISGFLFKDCHFANLNQLLKYLKRKILKLYLFYLKYELLFFVFTNLFFSIGFYNSNISYGSKIIYPISNLKSFLFGVLRIIIGFGREPFCSAFWFIISLMFIIGIYAIIVYVSNFTKRENITEFILVAFCVCIGFLMRTYYNIPRVGPAFSLIIMYYLGNICYRYKEKIKFSNIYVFLISIVGLLILSNFESVAINNNMYSSLLLFLLSSVLGVYIIIYIAKVIDSKWNNVKNVLSYIGNRTLYIIAFHLLSFKIVMILQYAFGQISYNDLGILTGVGNANALYIIYVAVGVIIPLCIEKSVCKIKNSISSVFCKNEKIV